MAALPINEQLVCQIWQGQHLSVAALRTNDGQPLQVVYRGRRSAEFGPDFRDAIVAVGDGHLLRGDVEVHVRASDWHAHGHDRDVRYNGVVLHVVLWADDPATHLASGDSVPLLTLADYLVEPLVALAQRLSPPAVPQACRTAAASAGARLGARLDQLGDERFARKAAIFESALTCRPPAQVLYEGLLEALGYSQNRAPFLAVARQLPLAILEGLLAGKPAARRRHLAEALLLGTAGLLPAQRATAPPLAADDYVHATALAETWRAYSGEQALSEDDWCFGNVRPENYPPRRLAGAAGLLATVGAEGLLEQVLGTLRAPEARLARAQQALFGVPADAYWALRYDFGCPASRAAALIGDERARTMGLDIVLPFALALAAEQGDGPQQELVWRLYRGYPRLGENAVSRRAAGRLFGQRRPDLVSSARRQQGLLHLERVYCEVERCAECPLTGTTKKDAEQDVSVSHTNT